MPEVQNGKDCSDVAQAVNVACRIGFPVKLRPHFSLGQTMRTAETVEEVRTQFEELRRLSPTGRVNINKD